MEKARFFFITFPKGQPLLCAPKTLDPEGASGEASMLNAKPVHDAR